MKVKKCVVCGCGFRPDEDENFCKVHNEKDLTEGQRLKAGLPIPGHKKAFTEDEIRDIVNKELDKRFPDVEELVETDNKEIENVG